MCTHFVEKATSHQSLLLTLTSTVLSKDNMGACCALLGLWSER